MRFGGYLAGLDPAEHYGFADWFEGLDFQIAWAKRFDWRCFLPTGFRDWNVDQQRVAVSKMADNDLVVPGLGAYRFNIIHPDPAVRADHVEQVCLWVERAAAAGIASVDNVSGSRHPTVSYGYAPGSKGDEAWTDFVKSAREICDACRGTNVRFVLEPCVATLLDSPTALNRAVESIDRPDELGINFDLVNLATMESCYDLNAVVDEVIELLGPRIVMAHVKDVRYDPTPGLHLWEVPPGEGLVDYRYWFGRLVELDRDMPVFIEHLRDMKQMVAAWQTVRNAAIEAGAL